MSASFTGRLTVSDTHNTSLRRYGSKALRYEDPRFLREIGKNQAAKVANGYIPYYWRTLDFLFKALARYWGKTGHFKDEEVEIEGETRG